jgi:hypothetical protein
VRNGGIEKIKRKKQNKKASDRAAKEFRKGNYSSRKKKKTPAKKKHFTNTITHAE